MAGLISELRRILQRTLRRSLREGTRDLLDRSVGRDASAGSARTKPKASRYPGDYQGMPRVNYAPLRGATPDPGEVVWTWVPFEEDHSRGKDRPVLLVGRDGPWLLGLQMTSVDHDRDASQEARAHRYWVDIGPGEWDSAGRSSEVRVNRVLRIDPDAVRRVSVALPEDVFARVVAGMYRHLD